MPCPLSICCSPPFCSFISLHSNRPSEYIMHNIVEPPVCYAGGSCTSQRGLILLDPAGKPAQFTCLGRGDEDQGVGYFGEGL